MQWTRVVGYDYMQHVMRHSKAMNKIKTQLDVLSKTMLM